MATFFKNMASKIHGLKPNKGKLTMPVKTKLAMAFVRRATLISEQSPKPNQPMVQKHFANKKKSTKLYSTSLEIVEYAAKWTQEREGGKSVAPCNIKDVFFLVTVTAGKVNEKIGEAYQNASNLYKKARGYLVVAVAAIGAGVLVAVPVPLNPFGILIVGIGAAAGVLSIHHFLEGLRGMKRVKEETKGELSAALYERDVLHVKMITKE